MQLANITKTRAFRKATKSVAFIMLLVLVFSPLQQIFSEQSVLIVQAQEATVNTEADDAALGVTDVCNSVGSCIAYVVYIFMVGLGSGAAYLGANFFNITVHMSLQSIGYGLEFISVGWTQTRDLANMAFIFILIYIAFTIMVKAETHGTMQMLARVVVIALLINFSFFLVRVVIDGGNILAIQFYNSINAPLVERTASGGGAQSLSASIFGPAGTKDLTASIMNAVDVTKILNTRSFQEFADGQDGQSGAHWWTEAITLAVVYIAVGAILFLLAAIFLTVGIKFMIRTVILWLAIIAAPLAMVMFTIPGNAKKYYFMWQHAVIAWSLYPAVFLFIFFQVSAFTDALAGCPTGRSDIGCSIAEGIFGDLAQTSAQGLGGFATLIAIITSVSIRLGFIVLLLYLTLKASDMISAWGGNFAHGVSAWAQGKMIGATKFGGGLYARGLAAGAGYGLRNTVGLAGATASRWAKAREGAGKPLGLGWQAFRGAGEFLGNRTFDPRNAPGGAAVLGLGGLVNVGKGQKGGYIERTKKAVDRKVKYGESLEPTPGEKFEADRALDYTATKKNLEALVKSQTREVEDARKELERVKQGKDTAAIDKADQLLQIRATSLKWKQDDLATLEAKYKKMTGDGNKKIYAETLLKGVLGTGIVFRSGQEAAAKINKGKSKEQKAKELLEEFTKDEGGETNAAAHAAATTSTSTPAHPVQPKMRESMSHTNEHGPLAESTEKIVEGIGKLIRENKRMQERLGQLSDATKHGSAEITDAVKWSVERPQPNTKVIKNINERLSEVETRVNDGSLTQSPTSRGARWESGRGRPPKTPSQPPPTPNSSEPSTDIDKKEG